MGVSNSSKTPLFGEWLGGNFVLADQTKTTGRYIYVNSGSSTGGDTSGYGASPDAPMLTLDAAIGEATANNGDVIILMPGHAETISAAADVVCDIAGITIVGQGNGADRPTFTFDTSAGADIDITANGVKFVNILFYADVDALTNPIHIAAADSCFEWCDFRDQAAKEAERWILTTAAGDRIRMFECKHEGIAAGDACVNFARLVGVDDCVIEDCNFYGNYSTAVIEFSGTVCNNIIVDACSFLETGTTDFSKSVVDTVTGSVWSVVKCWDPAAGSMFSGGSGGALAADDVGAVTAAVNSVGVQTSTVQSKTDSVGVQGSTGVSTSESVGIQASTVNSEVSSVGIQASTINSKSDSVGTATSTATSTAASVGVQTESVGVSASTGISTSESVGIQTSTVQSKTDSVGVQGSTGVSTSESVGIQASTLDSKSDSVGTAVSTSTSTGASVGIQVSTVQSKTDSVGVQGSTGVSTSESVGTFTSTLLSTNVSMLDSMALIISTINSKT